MPMSCLSTPMDPHLWLLGNNLLVSSWPAQTPDRMARNCTGIKPPLPFLPFYLVIFSTTHNTIVFPLVSRTLQHAYTSVLCHTAHLLDHSLPFSAAPFPTHLSQDDGSFPGQCPSVRPTIPRPPPLQQRQQQGTFAAPYQRQLEGQFRANSGSEAFRSSNGRCTSRPNRTPDGTTQDPIRLSRKDHCGWSKGWLAGPSRHNSPHRREQRRRGSHSKCSAHPGAYILF